MVIPLLYIISFNLSSFRFVSFFQQHLSILPTVKIFTVPNVGMLHRLPTRTWTLTTLAPAANVAISEPSMNWVSENKLFKKHPRLLYLETKCNSLTQLKQILSYIFISGLHHNPFVISRVLYSCIMGLPKEDFHMKRDFFILLFNQIEQPNIFSWNTIIRAFAYTHNPSDIAVAFGYYIEMLHRGVLPDTYTFPFLLQASGSISDLGLVKQVQNHVVKLGFLSDLFVQNLLIHVYVICGSVVDARRVFDEMPYRDVVSWTTLISGLVELGFYYESLMVFNRMMLDELRISPNVATVVSVMSGCANLGSLDHTKCFHAYLEKAGWCEVHVSIKNALIDAYAKCGSIQYFSDIFHEIPSCQRDAYSWTAMISGLAMNGHGREAIAYFSHMKMVDGLVPDSVTFIAVLCACTHAGLVDEGIQMFRSMEELGIKPELKHYGCMVDLFSRAGHVDYANDLLEKMPMEPNLPTLGSLLSACRVQNNVELGEVILQKIESCCEHGGGARVLLSNIYANENKWCKVGQVRMEMREGIKTEKPAGQSWIQVKGVVHEFVAGDKSHCQASELCMVLDGLGRLSLLY